MLSTSVDTKKTNAFSPDYTILEPMQCYKYTQISFLGSMIEASVCDLLHCFSLETELLIFESASLPY